MGSLSHHYRTYAVDVIGDLNKSILTRLLRRRQDFVDWMVDLFNGLQIESAYMVGNSGGGYLTLNTALYLPERVKKVVLISPAATFVQIWALYWHHLIPLAFIAPMIRSDRLVRKAYEWIWQGFPMDECYAQLRAIAQTAGYPRYSVTRNRGVRVAPVVFSDEELRKIQNPALLLIGDHEVIYKPERVIQRATRLVADLKAEIIPNANHVAEYTAPDVVNEKILKFFGDS